jgi:hypothetical protein
VEGLFSEVRLQDPAYPRSYRASEPLSQRRGAYDACPHLVLLDGYAVGRMRKQRAHREFVAAYHAGLGDKRGVRNPWTTRLNLPKTETPEGPSSGPP